MTRMTTSTCGIVDACRLGPRGSKPPTLRRAKKSLYDGILRHQLCEGASQVEALEISIRLSACAWSASRLPCPEPSLFLHGKRA